MTIISQRLSGDSPASACIALRLRQRHARRRDFDVGTNKWFTVKYQISSRRRFRHYRSQAGLYAVSGRCRWASVDTRISIGHDAGLPPAQARSRWSAAASGMLAVTDFAGSSIFCLRQYFSGRFLDIFDDGRHCFISYRDIISLYFRRIKPSHRRKPH